jgi:hypothetical protein
MPDAEILFVSIPTVYSSKREGVDNDAFSLRMTTGVVTNPGSNRVTVEHIIFGFHVENMETPSRSPCTISELLRLQSVTRKGVSVG